jgi:hypothetical protein
MDGVTVIAAGDAKPVALRRRWSPIIFASAAAVALVVSVGVFIGNRLLFGGPQPDERMPSSVVAYVSLDLNPGLDQTRKLLKIAEKMPQTGTDKQPRAALEDALDDLDLDAVDVKRDVAGWLDSRVAAALWMDGNHSMYALIAARSTDDAAAAAGLGRIKNAADGKLGFTVTDGWVLVAIDADGTRGDAQAAADAAAAEATATPLSTSAKYAEARTWLEADQVAVFFADYDVYRQALRSQLDREQLTPATSVEFSDMSTMPTGTMIAGLRAQDDGLSVRFRTFGGTQRPAAAVPDAVGKLGALPAGTAIGVVARLPEGTDLSPFASFVLPSLLGSESGDFEEVESGSPLTPAEEDELDALMEKQMSGSLTKAQEQRLEELMDKAIAVPSATHLTPAEQEELQRLLSKSNPTEADQKRITELLGVPTLPGTTGTAWDDLLGSLSGALVTVSASGLGAKPAFRAVVEYATAPDAKTAKRLTGLSDDEVTVKLDGTTLSLQSTVFTGTGRLADDPLYRKATAAVPAGDTQTAVYVDLTRLVPAEDRGELGAFQAILLVVGSDNSGLARVMIG